MKGLLFVGVILAICSTRALATETVSPGTEAVPNSALTLSHYGFWINRPQVAPAWSFNVHYIKPFELHPSGSAIVKTHTLPDTLTFSASRALPYFRSQRLFAAFQASNTSQLTLPAELYQLPNTGMAASFGWQLGRYNRFNMAVEYEYREVAEQDINSVLLGVQYYF